jgi:hypothetical protein
MTTILLGAKAASLLALDGTAEQAVEKLVSKQKAFPQRLKPHSKQCTYRSAEALRHPKQAQDRLFPQAVKPRSAQSHL